MSNNNNNNSESDDDYEDADERYFYRRDDDDDWDDDVNDEEDEDDFDDEGDADEHDDDDMDNPPSAQELDGEMVNWYARSHERYIKNLINGEQVEDYGLSIPLVATAAVAAAAAAVNNNNNDEEELVRAENNVMNCLNTGPIFGDSPRGDGVSCELKSDVVVPHNRTFMRQWINYTDALRECRILRLFEEFSMYKIHLHASVSNLIFAALEGKHLKKLTLSETNLCSAGIENLTRYLGSNTTLQRLTLDKNPIFNSVDTQQFGRALRKHPQLEYLSLCDCKIGDNVNTLSDILHAGMKEICLGSNKIGSRGGLIIASYLASNPPMESINLERNQLNDDDVLHFANSLRTNTRLRQLTLSANRYSLDGVKSLFKEIFNPTTLNNVADCNHTCTLSLFTKYFNPVQRINNSVDANENRRGKILLALRIADTQLHYFKGVPLELMHFVIRQIQQEEVFTNKLTRIFVVMKGWIVPNIAPPNQKQPSRSKRKRGSA